MGEGTLRALKVAVVAMGVLIVGGTAVLGVLIAQRMSGGSRSATTTQARGNPVAPLDVALDGPVGTRILGLSIAGDRVALIVATPGEGEEVRVLDLRSGQVVARVSVPHG